MAAPIVGGLITYLATQLSAEQGLGVEVWDGEVPRYDSAGKPITASNVTGSWPVIKLAMGGAGFGRRDTVGLTGSYTDVGPIEIRFYATTREVCEALMTSVEELMELQLTIADPNNVALGGPASNPNYVVESHLDRWWCGTDDENRTSTSQLLYRGEHDWRLTIKGTVRTGAS